jgi:hypothetical protein
VEEDHLLPRRSFFDGDGKKLPSLHGMKAGEVHMHMIELDIGNKFFK